MRNSNVAADAYEMMDRERKGMPPKTRKRWMHWEVEMKVTRRIKEDIRVRKWIVGPLKFSLVGVIVLSFFPFFSGSLPLGAAAWMEVCNSNRCCYLFLSLFYRLLFSFRFLSRFYVSSEDNNILWSRVTDDR